MVRPDAFDYNPETAGSNSLQRRTALSASEARECARAEFEGVVGALRSEGVRVCVAQDTPDPPKPDAVFPNNWVSFHADGTVVLYPMQAPTRRRERRREIVAQVADELGFRVRRTLDLTRHESAGRFLEGTGSLVLDHAARVAYACRSPRTDEDVLEEWCRQMGYEPLAFSASDASGTPFYHTNVMLAVGARVAVVGSGSIAPAERRRVLDRLEASGREIIEVGHDGIARFACNVLELAVPDRGVRREIGGAALGGGHRVLVMSSSARRAFDAPSYARLAARTETLLIVDVPTIEELGGGGVRCMLAEVFSAS